LTSNFLAAVTATLQQEARIAARNWFPLRSWTYSGGDMTLIVHGNQAIIFETAKANIDTISKAFSMVCYLKK
jgi:roadblock/LC7 domain-containing protein